VEYITRRDKERKGKTKEKKNEEILERIVLVNPGNCLVVKS
jgi:hypothetical protein